MTDMTLFTLPDVGIKDSDRELIRSLARSLTPEQAVWVGGYLAGAAEARSELMALTGEATTVISRARTGPAPVTTFKILYASETGNAAALARDVESAAQALGLKASAEDLARYKPRGLKDEETVLFIASTHGEGDPPENAAGFFEFLSGRKAPSLEGLRFAVLALGDSTYEFFCEAGKLLDRRLEELGAVRIQDRQDCDVDYEQDAQQWTQRILERLQSEGAAPAAGSSGGSKPAGAASPRAVATAAAAATAASASTVVTARTAAMPVLRYGKNHPFDAQVIENIRLTGRESSKDTRHLEFSLEGSGLEYLPGDALGVHPRNDPALVDELLGLFGWTGSEAVAARAGETEIGKALAQEYEITALTPRFIEQWATLSGDKRLATTAAGSRAELAEFMTGNQIIDLIKAKPVPGLSPQAFLASLRSLQPRLYSIASSADFVPGEAHVCVAPVRFRLHERDRHGVASRYLADALDVGSSAPVHVQRNDNFRLPADPSTPIIMVGAGTGIAPYRAFMQHREAHGVEGRSWLFFGERNFRSDFLYQLEWQEWHRSKALTRVDLAFSRDQQQKVYVQHRLQEQGAELFRWLEDGAHLYVCGDAEQMARDVQAALVAVVVGQSGRDTEAAEAYLRELQAAGRYQKDVY
jgi:sulfite reductase (NADPH) flavoprotein alpha-component